MKPAVSVLIIGTLLDLTRNRTDLVIENALLRQQLIILKRQIKRPQLTKTARFRLVFLFHFTVFWKDNQLWGVERTQGELLKLVIEVSKRTIQRYMPEDRKRVKVYKVRRRQAQKLSVEKRLLNSNCPVEDTGQLVFITDRISHKS